MNTQHYTYRVIWSEEDGEFVGLCVEFPSLSRLSDSMETAIKGVVADTVADMQARREDVPVPIGKRHYSGRFQVRIPPQRHRLLAVQAAEQGIRLNRLVSDRLA